MQNSTRNFTSLAFSPCLRIVITTCNNCTKKLTANTSPSTFTTNLSLWLFDKHQVPLVTNIMPTRRAKPLATKLKRALCVDYSLTVPTVTVRVDQTTLSITPFGKNTLSMTTHPLVLSYFTSRKFSFAPYLVKSVMSKYADDNKYRKVVDAHGDCLFHRLQIGFN